MHAFPHCAVQDQLQGTVSLAYRSIALFEPEPKFESELCLACQYAAPFKSAGIFCRNDPREGVKLDDGWPESVGEQSLLLLVWEHYIRRQYIKNVK